MYVHRSNRTEQLLDALCELVATPAAGSSVFEPECIVVQGPGMERWLGLELSRRLGIWANPAFPFPRALLERAMQSVLGPVEDPGISFEPETLMWSVASVLPELLDDPRFAPLRGYLRDDASGEKLIQLSERIAHAFDRYVIYRPEWVLAWEAGRETALPGLDPSDLAWQSELWRALVQRHGSVHLAARMDGLLRALESRRVPLEDFPSRFSLFGISTLPPLYLRGLAALSSSSEVHLFVLSPSREYWADIRSRREQLRASKPSSSTPALFDPDALHFEEGNALLASLGRLGREFQAMVEDAVDYREGERDLYLEPRGDDMLAILQRDILQLQGRGLGPGDLQPQQVAPDDRSIAVHSCHGPMREAEVLRDQLLALFDADPTLEPRDVVVMTPDIETYAPYLEAAFGGGSGQREGGAGRVRIPCRISDRSVRATHQGVEAFGRLLDLLDSRMKASDVLDLLASDPIRARFGFGPDDPVKLQRWIDGSGIRWGIDAAHRLAEGQPESMQNTWRFGLDRLLLGRALPAEIGGAFGERAPYVDSEGGDAELLGRLAEFCEVLFSFRARAARPLPWSAWGALLEELLGAMLRFDSDSAHELQLVREALQSLSGRAESAGHRSALPLAVMREQLEAAFASSRPSSGFLSGGVTFCEMVPMRSIPFRVVCLMGMSDEAFPRIRRPQSFDLIAQRRRLGDRSSRDDDRYLFLEALLSARDHLIITHPGQDVRSNVEGPPSVVVGELLDQIGAAFLPDASSEPGSRSAAEMRARVTLRHPLQPFSPRYFGADADSRLFSYAQQYCDGARVLVGERSEMAPFLPTPIVPEPELIDTLPIKELVDWIQNPTRHFLRSQLALRLEEMETPVEDREPLDLAGLSEWAVGTQLLERAVEVELDDAALALVRASGALPLGVPGACAFEEIERSVGDLSARVRKLRASGALPNLTLDRDLAGIAIRGTLDGLFECGQLRHHYNKLEGRSELEVWLRHLLLNWIAPTGYPLQSHLVGRSSDGAAEHVRFRPVEDPERHLVDLVSMYRQGRTTALPLFPRSSRKYAARLKTNVKQGTPEEKATLDAYESYRGDEFRRGECEDPYLRQAFGALDPLSPSFSPTGDPEARDGFRALARRVFDPLLAHREEGQ
jgi:exodeoxyribonuclease V gamma subunit